MNPQYVVVFRWSTVFVNRHGVATLLVYLWMLSIVSSWLLMFSVILQVFEDFLGHVAWKANLEAALELAALKVCRDCLEKQAFVITIPFFLSPLLDFSLSSEISRKSCLDHKVDIDSVDLDAAMQAFIPKTVLCSANTKVCYFLFSGFPRISWPCKSYNFLAVSAETTVYTTAQEIRPSTCHRICAPVSFHPHRHRQIWRRSLQSQYGGGVWLCCFCFVITACSNVALFLEVGWASPVDLLVGPEVGLSYRINERCEVRSLIREEWLALHIFWFLDLSVSRAAFYSGDCYKENGAKLWEGHSAVEDFWKCSAYGRSRFILSLKGDIRQNSLR